MQKSYRKLPTKNCILKSAPYLMAAILAASPVLNREQEDVEQRQYESPSVPTRESGYATTSPEILQLFGLRTESPFGELRSTALDWNRHLGIVRVSHEERLQCVRWAEVTNANAFALLE
jgi:hypothetical protein